MSVLEWKKFNFFNLAPSADYNKLKKIKGEITAQCYNVTQRVFCDAFGCVHVFFKNWEYISFQAHSEPITLCAITSENKVLVTAAQEKSKNELFVQIFNINKITKRNGAPVISTARLTTPSPATVVRACLIDVQVCIAIGLERGDILLHRAVISRDTSSNFRCLNVSTRSITGIEFRQTSPSSYSMFVCSDAGVFCYTLADNNVVADTKTVLDTTKGPSRCCALYRDSAGEPYFVVGRDDAVYCFTSDGRGPCYAIEGRKNCIACFGNNLLVVMEPNQTQSLAPEAFHLIIIDIYNKLITFSKLLDAFSSVLVENSNCYILTKSKEVFILRERDVQSKLRLLISKNLYDIALRFQEESNSSNDMKGQIYMQYGDYLIMKGDLSGAVDKYIKTVGLVEPYCIIRKLLDSRDNRYLAQYLRALVSTEYATQEHLILLKNCSDRLDLPLKMKYLFNDNELHRSMISDVKPTMNIERYGNIPDTSLSTFLNIMNNQTRVCEFFANMVDDDVQDFFLKNGNFLMKNQPRATTDILKQLVDKSLKSPERLIPVVMAHDIFCIEFLEHVISSSTNCGKTIYNFLFELYLRAWHTSKSYSEEKILEFLRDYYKLICHEHAVILCRNYSFWPGIMHLYENCLQGRLSVRYLVQRCDVKNALTNVDHTDDLNPHIWIQALTKERPISHDSIKLINYLLNTILEEKHQSLLQILQSISVNEDILVSHIRDFFTEDNLQKVAGSKHQHVTVKNLYSDMTGYSRLLSKFSQNPIEFRSSVCDICRQQLKLPAVYYLCQHSFHKECVFAYSENVECVACTADRKHRPTSDQYCSEIDFEKLPKELASGNIIELVSEIFYKGLLDQFVKGQSYTLKNSQNSETVNLISTTATRNMMGSESAETKKWAGRFKADEKVPSKSTLPVRKPAKSTNPFEDEEEVIVSTNPFDEYDANLNPFDD